MLKHADVWQALDRLASEYNMSPSGLARSAGLDATTFNKSKRIAKDGKQHWPSTESLAKVLASTGASINEYVSYIGVSGGGGVYRNIPMAGLAQAGKGGYFDDSGYPVGGGWEQIPFPAFADPHAYAVEIIGDSMDPVLRDGDTVIVSPEAGIRRGDRVVVKTAKGEVMAKNLMRQTATKIVLSSVNAVHKDRTLAVEDVEWMARIIWVSQ